MGHYCRRCGRTRANEKFSGKGHKNHVCKDCSGKSSKKANKNNWNENTVATKNIVASLAVPIQSEDMYFDDNWLSEIGFEKQNIDDENDEELPF
jgi:hypothetical protein